MFYGGESNIELCRVFNNREKNHLPLRSAGDFLELTAGIELLHKHLIKLVQSSYAATTVLETWTWRGPHSRTEPEEGWLVTDGSEGYAAPRSSTLLFSVTHAFVQNFNKYPK